MNLGGGIPTQARTPGKEKVCAFGYYHCKVNKGGAYMYNFIYLLVMNFFTNTESISELKNVDRCISLRNGQ